MDILFVCTGNTCRSCMAEAIFNSLGQLQNVTSISAGLSVVRHSKTSPNAAAVIKDNLNIDLSVRDAVQLNKDMLVNSDLILTMTVNMKNTILLSFPNLNNKIFTLNEFVGINGDIIDPYGGDLSQYTETFHELKNRILLLFDKLKEDRGIN